MVTEETPLTGDEQLPGARDQGKPTATAPDAGKAEGQGDPRRNRPDGTGDEKLGGQRGASTPGKARPCTCCGNPLPPPTAQQKKPRKFCPDGAGGYEERFGITCGELGPAKEKYERVFGREAVPGADLEHLGAQITTAQGLLGPTSPLAGLFRGLTGTLTGVGERLDGTVAAAIAETARATAAEREALGREAAAIIERDAANGLAQQAVLDRQDMEHDRNTKVRAAEDRATEADKGKRLAEIAQGKAEGERDQHKDRADRSDKAADTARTNLMTATEANAVLTAQNEELKSQLEQANARANEERGRADSAVKEANRVRTEAGTKLEKIRKETAEQIERARSAANTAVEAARGETTLQAAKHTATLERIGRERAVEQAEHARTLAVAGGRTEQLQQRVRDGLARLLRAVTTTPPVGPGQEDDLGQQLHRVTAAQMELRHGIEDLIRDLELD